MKIPFLFMTLSIASVNAIAGDSFGCQWAKAKLQTAIKMQEDYSEKQRYYVRENGNRSDKYSYIMESAREDEREARAEIGRKCN